MKKGPTQGLLRWHAEKDSNLQPLVLETSALPIELPTYISHIIHKNTP